MFIGQKLAEVQAQLDQMGLGANMVPDASPAPDASKVGTAYFVNPTGNVRKNDTITVRFYGAVPATPTQPDPLTAGTNVANVVKVTSLTWTLAPTPATKNTMSYLAQCSGAASPSSQTLTQISGP
jgi:hypothetical protein